MTVLLLCVDLETTGLDPHVDLIMEVGWILVAPTLDELDRDEALVAPPPGAGDPDALMIEVVRRMHEQSGLLDAYRTACRSKVILAPNLVARAIVDRIDQISPDATVHLAGSGVERFDKPFIDHHMPALGRRLHYASVDVSSIRRFAKIVAGVDLEPAGVKPHRGLADAEHALTTMRGYRDWISPHVLEQRDMQGAVVATYYEPPGAPCGVTAPGLGDKMMTCTLPRHPGPPHRDPSGAVWWWDGGNSLPYYWRESSSFGAAAVKP